VKLFDLQDQRKEALNVAEGIVTVVERANRDMTAAEKGIFEAKMAEADALAPPHRSNPGAKHTRTAMRSTGIFSRCGCK